MKIIVDKVPKTPDECPYYNVGHYLSRRCGLRIGMNTDFSCRLEQNKECPFLIEEERND